MTCPSSEWNELDTQISKPRLLRLFQCYFHFAFGNSMKLANPEPRWSQSALTLLSSLSFHRDSFLRLYSRSLTLKARGSERTRKWWTAGCFWSQELQLHRLFYGFPKMLKGCELSPVLFLLFPCFPCMFTLLFGGLSSRYTSQMGFLSPYNPIQIC